MIPTFADTSIADLKEKETLVKRDVILNETNMFELEIFFV